MDKSLPKLFLSVGHAHGARPGVNFKEIQEEEYNIAIREQIINITKTRISIENLVNQLPYPIYEGLVRTNIISPMPYELYYSGDTEGEPLYGKYAQRQKEAYEHNINAVIQMHLNATPAGKYSLVTYCVDNHSLREQNDKMAHIFAEVLDEELAPDGDETLIRKGKHTPRTQIWSCSVNDAGAPARSARALQHSKIPAIIIEPLFVDNPVHYDFLNSEIGFKTIVKIYIKALERIALEMEF